MVLGLKRPLLLNFLTKDAFCDIAIASDLDKGVKFCLNCLLPEESALNIELFTESAQLLPGSLSLVL